jgi:hypothetical protein
MSGDLDVPFEQGPSGQTVDLSDGRIASGLVVMAAMLPLPDRGTMPCLVYRFAVPDGSGFYPPMLLAVDEDQMLKLAQLTASASAAAIKAAS